MTYKPEYSCAVLSDISLKKAIELYGLDNCCFGRLWVWEGFNFTETEFIFSFAASKFQHLIDFKSL